MQYRKHTYNYIRIKWSKIYILQGKKQYRRFSTLGEVSSMTFCCWGVFRKE